MLLTHVTQACASNMAALINAEKPSMHHAWHACFCSIDQEATRPCVADPRAGRAMACLCKLRMHAATLSACVTQAKGALSKPFHAGKEARSHKAARCTFQKSTGNLGGQQVDSPWKTASVLSTGHVLGCPFAELQKSPWQAHENRESQYRHATRKVKAPGKQCECAQAPAWMPAGRPWVRQWTY